MSLLEQVKIIADLTSEFNSERDFFLSKANYDRDQLKQMSERMDMLSKLRVADRDLADAIFIETEVSKVC